MAKVTLHLGSNLGQRKAHLLLAISHLNDELGNITKQSSIYETAAWGVEDQPAFLNIALVLETKVLPCDLLKIALAIEQEMGRERKRHWGERLIDIDILFYNDWKINYPNLIIPHPRIQDRKFVLQPLWEIIPNRIHPVLNKTIKTLLMECPDELPVELYVK